MGQKIELIVVRDEHNLVEQRRREPDLAWEALILINLGKSDGGKT
jgi:hypothetical protein